MGRDFTPREFHNADIQFGVSKGKTRCIDDDGNEVVLYDPASYPRFPRLNFLFHEHFEKLYKEWGECHVLNVIEATLAMIIKGEELGIKPEEWQKLAPTDDPLYFTSKWYEGKLDPNFYYNTENDNRFEKLIRKANTSNLSSFVDRL